MSCTKRNFDLIVFGASGFTGRFVVSAAAQLWCELKWAIAGRSETKLKSVIQRLSSNENIPEIILADVNDEDSLKAMTEQTKVLVSVVGPYRKFGESVVKACISTSTNLLDICGEPEFLERIQYKYNQQALNAGCLIIGSCGFDSIPADLGMVKLGQHFEPDGILIKAESFLCAKGGKQGLSVHYATYEAAVLGFGSSDDLKKLRHQAETQKLNYFGPKLEVKYGPFADGRVPNRSCYLFMGSDSSVIRRTQEQLTRDNPSYVAPQTAIYFTIEEGIMNNAKMMFFGGTFQLLAKYQRGRDLLLKYPSVFSNGLFSHEGPTKEQIEETTFEMIIFGTGYSDKSKLHSLSTSDQFLHPDRHVTLKISGPEPGYVATAKLVTCAALNVLMAQQNSTLLPRGGVFTPGYIFRHCNSFMEGIKNEGILFDFIEHATNNNEQNASS